MFCRSPASRFKFPRSSNPLYPLRRMASQPAKRVRTGCLKCRVRRRKCDEGKPRCQRCISGGFDCQYGTRLSFLDKNAFTVNEPAPPVKENAAAPSYRKVQFVDEPSNKDSHQEHDASDPAGQQSSLPSRGESSVPKAAIETSNGRRHSSPVGGHDQLHDEQQAPTTFGGWNSSILSSPVTSGGDQIALDALLSLGNEHATAFVDSNLRRSSVASIPLIQAEIPAHIEDNSVNAGGSSHDIPVNINPPDHGIPDIPTFSLLKTYRYELAPWLDICDLGQTFGMAVPCLATESGPVLQNILALSAAFTGASSKDGRTHIPSGLARFNESNTDPEERLLCMSLSRAGGIFNGDFGLNDGLDIHNILRTAHQDIGSTLASPVPVASYYVLIRLVVSRGLMHETPVPIPVRMPGVLPSHWHRTELAKQVFQCAHAPLILCIRVMNFCWGETSDRLGPSGDMVRNWRSLVDDLNTWFTSRPQEFMSMVEIDNADDGFPVILFTSGAAVFGNQLYHTAMFLLLRHKPRTVILPSRHRSSTMSTLWHARRICGIALNNDRRECWDTSLVASLLVSARTMTHEAQHRALLAGIDKVENLTAWKLDSVRNILKMEWGV
ncbi:hypothetical protein JX265_005699 [Neoarthrinium moseri]|uniref:Zn(2)-C6 fungal-type domain-containing protein n=1 Tax=Neoarthrinium moseri TaxID=1658444 RepID=A0A9P9WNA1_9PEZI|nr:hypothetical protein JX265_005699 [Neoarthrinium moseri]